ncbi:MAG: SpoIIE family protein phosphatase [Pseudomonadales bacterium]
MRPAPPPNEEIERLAALQDYAILDTLPEQAYDDISFLASQVCETPIAVISLVDEHRQWFKSHLGVDAQETPREVAFCAHAILQPDSLLVVEDATRDERFADNPLVLSDPGVRFYAGAPLVTSEGHALGTLCVIDRKPRKLTPAQAETLKALSRQVIAQLELQRTVRRLENRNRQLKKSRGELTALVRMLEGQASVIERDLHRAEIIQRSLLPHEIPSLANFNVHSLYRPGHTIGGDLYDVMTIGDRYLALVIADASGHGVSAAMLSVLFKHHLHLKDETTGEPHRPAAALAQINASLLANQPAPGVFVTAACCLLDTVERKLIVASAGHPPLLCVRSDGTLEEIEHTGPALGLEADASYEERELLLQEGDKLLLYTDGLFDICEATPTVRYIADSLDQFVGDPHVLEKMLLEVTHRKARHDCDDVTLVLLSASSGASIFNDSAVDLNLLSAPAGAEPGISYAETADTTIVMLEGRLTWFYGQILFDTAMAVVESKRNLVIDLARCEYLDSTMLGTLHEIIQQASAADGSVLLQNVGANLREDFEELSMKIVLANISEDAVEIPEKRVALDLKSSTLDHQQLRLLRAHEVLAELSDDNREQFGALVETLRGEMKAR